MGSTRGDKKKAHEERRRKHTGRGGETTKGEKAESKSREGESTKVENEKAQRERR